MILSRLAQRLADFRKPAQPAPRLSLVVVVFNMRREAPRTLNHYSPDYILIHDPPWPHEAGAGTVRAAGRPFRT